MRPRVAMMILAGGSGTRFDAVGSGSSKVYQSLAGRPILSYSLAMAATSQLIDRLVVVIREDDRDEATRLVAQAGMAATLVVGGTTRHSSEANGFEALAPEIEAGEIELAAVHDAARPFVTIRLLSAIIDAAVRHGGAVPGLPVDDVVVDVRAGTVADAGRLYRVQTPQIFLALPALLAFRRAAREGFAGVDTAETVQRFSDVAVAVTPGDPDNLKLTYPGDMEIAARRAAQWRLDR